LDTSSYSVFVTHKFRGNHDLYNTVYEVYTIDGPVPAK